MKIIKKIAMLAILGGLATTSYASSEIKVICDRDGESIYLNGQFKSTCDSGEPVSMIVKAGRYTVVVKKRDKEARYKYEKKFRIGDGLRKVVESHVKAIYNEYHYYKNVLNQESLEACKEYLKNYPNGKHIKAINEIKTYILAKKDFSYYKAYKQKYPRGKFLQKLKEYYMAHPLIAILRGHDSVRSLALTKDNLKLFSCGDDEKITEWSLKNYKKIKTFTYNHGLYGAIGIQTIALSSDEKDLYSNGKGRLRKWDIQSGQNSNIGKYAPDHIITLDKNQLLLFRSDRFDIFDLNSKKILYTYIGNKGYDAGMETCVLSKDKRYLFFSMGLEIIKFDLQSRKIIKIFKSSKIKYSITSLSITPDNRYLIIGTCNDIWADEDGYLRKTVIILDLRSGKPYKVFKQKGTISAIAVDPKGEFCAIGTTRGEIFLRDIKTGMLIKKINAYSSVNDLKFTNDDSKLIAALSDNAVKIWQVGFYNKKSVLHSLLNECKKGDIVACNDYIVNGGKGKRIAKKALLDKFKTIIKSFGGDIVYNNPKVYLYDTKNVYKYFPYKNKYAIYTVESIISNGVKTYILIDVNFVNSGFTFNGPIYLMQNSNKKNFSN